MTARWSRTRVTTTVCSPISPAARAMGRKWEAKNQSSVTTKTIFALPDRGGVGGSVTGRGRVTGQMTDHGFYRARR